MTLYVCQWIEVGELVCGACLAGYMTPTMAESCGNCGATVAEIQPEQPPFDKCPKVIVARETP